MGNDVAGVQSVVATDLSAVEKRLYICTDADEASVAGSEPKCPKCSWTTAVPEPSVEVEKLTALVASGLADRFQRFKDAAIATILKKAAETGDRPDLAQLLEIAERSRANDAGLAPKESSDRNPPRLV